METFTNLSTEQLLMIGAFAPFLVANIIKFLGLKGARNKKIVVILVSIYIAIYFNYPLDLFKAFNTVVLLTGVSSGLYDISKRKE